MLVRSIAAALLFAVAGCNTLGIGGSEAAIVTATPTQVTVNFKEGDLDSATARARDHCAGYGRTARLERVAPGDGSKRIAVFNCV